MDRRFFLGLALTTVLTGLFSLTPNVQAVKGSGQLTDAYTLSLSSREDCDCKSNLGAIIFDGVAYSLPQSIGIEAKSYSIRYDAASWYEFSQWETSGEASITDHYSSSTTVTVSGNGAVVAIYRKTVISYTVYLDSLEDTQATSHLGNITLDGVTCSLPSWETLRTSTAYPIWFNVPSGYEFDHWETIDGTRIVNVSVQSTWVVVSGTGYITGVYRKSVPQPVYDLALNGIDVRNNSVVQGQMLPINVTVMNEGTNDEVCNLTMYANDVQFYSVQQMLTPGETRTISIDWNTSGLLGNYTLTAHAELLAGEVHTDDNNLVYEPAITIEKAYMTADLNKDGTIDIRDIAVVAVAYGSNATSPSWNALADLNDDGTVNIVDISMVAKDFGKTF